VAKGAAQGALSGIVSGAVAGGIGIGAALGAALGAIGGIFTGVQAPPPDVAGFTERALPDTTLHPGFSVTGYVYYPAGDYGTLEVLLTDGDTVVSETVHVEAER
jgi:hypothetical protein